MKNAAAFLGLFALLLAAGGLLVSCSGDGDDPAPDNISGTWVGTATDGGETVGVTAVITQTGSSLSLALTVEGEGTVSGSGTYENGIAVITWSGGGAELKVSGNKMTGVAATAEGTSSVNLTKQ